LDHADQTKKFICSYCSKAWNRPSDLGIEDAVHFCIFIFHGPRSGGLEIVYLCCGSGSKSRDLPKRAGGYGYPKNAKVKGLGHEFFYRKGFSSILQYLFISATENA
jgi:hypothetical protein